MTAFCRPYFRRRDGRSWRAASASYLPSQIAKAYQLPPGLDGTGRTVGIVELGGAYSSADLIAYCNAIGVHTPDVQAVNVAGGSQQNDPGGANVEVMLDVCIVAALAPGSKIRVYFAPNSDQGFAAAVTQAAQDGCDAISISWGAAESQWSASGRQAMDAAVQAAGAQGIATFVAAGDNGSGDAVPGVNVDYPASSPWVVGCGGTALRLNPDGSIVSETVWNNGVSGGATGGGFSTIYPLPAYQANSKIPGSKRGVPDVAGVADPETGWTIRADGAMTSVGGTSAVAPMWAAIHVLLCQKAGSRVFSPVQSLFYAHPEAFFDTITGSNGVYNAGTGWDPCTGLGSPRGSVLFSLPLTVAPPVPVPVPTPVPTPTPPAGVEIVIHGQFGPGYYMLLKARGPGRFTALEAKTQVPVGDYTLTPVGSGPATQVEGYVSLEEIIDSLLR